MKNKVVKNRKRNKRTLSQLFYHGMMLPGMILLFIFSYIPMFGIVMAFQNYIPAKGFLGSKWVGLKHFKSLLTIPDCWEITRNTLTISLGKIAFGMIATVTFAILLNEIKVKWLKKVSQTVTYLPHFLSWVVLSTSVINIFKMDGIINQFLEIFGIEAINFIGSNKWFQPMIVGTHVWKEVGYGSIVYLAAITAIDPGLHEAASIDGASWWQRVWHITLPGMLPIILVTAAMNVSHILSAGFDQIYNLYSPIVYETADIIDTYVYRVGLVGGKYSLGSAIGLLKSIVGMALMLGTNEFAKKFANRRIF